MKTMTKICYNKDLRKVSSEALDCIIKIILDEETQGLIFMVKKDPDTGLLYNPNEEKTTREFHRVNEKVYDYYLRFIKTNNELWLRHAEREFV